MFEDRCVQMVHLYKNVQKLPFDCFHFVSEIRRKGMFCKKKKCGR